jgi:hypothetical protein
VQLPSAVKSRRRARTPGKTSAALCGRGPDYRRMNHGCALALLFTVAVMACTSRYGRPGSIQRAFTIPHGPTTNARAPEK